VLVKHGFKRTTGRVFERQEDLIVGLALVDYGQQVWMAYLGGCPGFVSDSSPKCGICGHSWAKYLERYL